MAASNKRKGVECPTRVSSRKKTLPIKLRDSEPKAVNAKGSRTHRSSPKKGYVTNGKKIVAKVSRISTEEADCNKQVEIPIRTTRNSRITEQPKRRESSKKKVNTTKQLTNPPAVTSSVEAPTAQKRVSVGKKQMTIKTQPHLKKQVKKVENKETETPSVEVPTAQKRATVRKKQMTIKLRETQPQLKKQVKKEPEKVITGSKRKSATSEKSPPAKKLRCRRDVKYRESSFDATKPESKKVPIYNQVVPPKTQNKKKDDYEFDSDSETKKISKKNKNSSFNDSSFERFLKREAKKQHKKIPRKRVVKKTKQKVVIDEVFFNPNQTGAKRVSLKTTTTPKTVEVPTQAVKVVSPPHDSIIDFCSSDEEENHDPVIESPTKVKVLNNIELTPRNELYLNMSSPAVFKMGESVVNSTNVSSPALFNMGQPDANSTMINKALTPWRFNDVNIRRNPHFISYKQSSLPRINQDMVVDHSLVAKLNDVAKSPSKTAKKPLKQGTITNYLSSNKENIEHEENTNLSLFDIDQFSPIKNRSRFVVTKRKVLGERNENVIQNQCVSSSIEMLKSPNRVAGIEANFGFDTDDDVENMPPKEKNDKPFRLSMRENDKKYQPKRKVVFKKPESVPNSDEENDVSESEDANGQFQLFEDFNATPELVDFEVKRKRKLNGDPHRAKKRKDVRSKEEEEEAERWAAAFNSMCDEVDKFPLEIE